MLNYHFNKKLLTTDELLKELSISISSLDFWKTQWRVLHHKKSKSLKPYKEWVQINDPCWEMGLRLIGKKAFYDPIIFLNWISEHKLKNKPIVERDKNLVFFVQRNTSQHKKVK